MNHQLTGACVFSWDMDMDARVQRLSAFCCPWTQKPEVMMDKKVPL